MTLINWDAATALIEDAQTVVVVTHISPDGDAIGSMLGIAHMMQALGKTVTCAVDDGSPDMFNFLPGAADIRKKLFKGEWDLMISTDASDEERTGDVGTYARANSKAVINLDHHATNTQFGDAQLVDPEAVSAAEVAFRWAQAMDLPITETIAWPILTGLVTDTIGFRTSNVTADTLQIAQQLIAVGASLTEVTERTLDNRSFVSVTLWKHVLQSVKLRGGGIVSAEVTAEDFKRIGTAETSDYGLVGFLIKITEAMIAIVFKEVEDGKINISMRAKPGFDVSQVAFAVGGGGHKQAAGATIDGPMEDAKKQILPMLRDVVKAGKLVIA
jgi:bifunctional oligoribonuclease and PAP phosphatase NrnA